MKVARVGVLDVSSSQRKYFQFFAIENDVCCGFVVFGFYCNVVGSLCACFLVSFYHKWLLNFVKSFFWSVEMIIWFLFFNLLMWCITLIELHILKDPCISGIIPTWSWYVTVTLLMCCWIWFASILLRILHLNSSIILTCKFLFCGIFVWFWYQDNGDFIERAS